MGERIPFQIEQNFNKARLAEVVKLSNKYAKDTTHRIYAFSPE